MPTALGSPLSIEDFAHSDDSTVEYVLHPLTTRVRVQPVGDDCRVHIGAGEGEGGTISSGFGQYWPVADGELEPFKFSSARANPPVGFTTPRPQGKLRGVRARTEGRSLFVALNTGPGTVRIVCDRG
jgi:hypothetical protein